VQKGAEAPPFLWEKGAPANFKIPKILTKFSFGIGMVNTEKIPKGSYRNTESVYNSTKKDPVICQPISVRRPSKTN
jgi:hypothetical protein